MVISMQLFHKRAIRPRLEQTYWSKLRKGFPFITLPTEPMPIKDGSCKNLSIQLLKITCHQNLLYEAWKAPISQFKKLFSSKFLGSIITSKAVQYIAWSRTRWASYLFRPSDFFLTWHKTSWNASIFMGNWWMLVK